MNIHHTTLVGHNTYPGRSLTWGDSARLWCPSVTACGDARKKVGERSHHVAFLSLVFLKCQSHFTCAVSNLSLPFVCFGLFSLAVHSEKENISLFSSLFFYFYASYAKNPPELFFFGHTKSVVTWHIPAEHSAGLFEDTTLWIICTMSPKEITPSQASAGISLMTKCLLLQMQCRPSGQAVTNFRGVFFIISWLFGEYVCKGNFQFKE